MSTNVIHNCFLGINGPLYSRQTLNYCIVTSLAVDKLLAYYRYNYNLTFQIEASNQVICVFKVISHFSTCPKPGNMVQ